MGYPIAKINSTADSAAKIRQLLDVIEPEVIIECPACQTKFRIEASKLSAGESTAAGLASAGKAKARFHCSRCDYVFAAEVASSDIHTNNDNHSKTSEFRHRSETIQESESINENELSNIQVEPDNETEQMNESVNQSATQDPMHVEPYIEENQQNIIQQESSPEQPESHEYDITMSNKTTEQLTFNFKRPNENTEVKSEDISKITDNLLSSSRVDDTLYIDSASIEEALNKLQSPPKEIDKSDSYAGSTSGWTNLAAGSRIDNNPAQDKPPVDYSRYAQDFSQEEQNIESGSDFQSGGNPISSKVFSPSFTPKDVEFLSDHRALNAGSGKFALAIFILPLIVVLTLLGATTLYLGKNLRSSEKLLSTLFPKAMRESPAGVFVQQPKLESLVLDSGDIVNVVSGVLVNQSNKILSAVTIEGLGFSDSGKIISSEKVLIGNPISTNNVTLKTLTPSNIRELQSKEPKHFILRPDAKTKFWLVFTKPVKANISSSSSDNDSKMTSFSVRVYSARF